MSKFGVCYLASAIKDGFLPQWRLVEVVSCNGGEALECDLGKSPKSSESWSPYLHERGVQFAASKGGCYVGDRSALQVVRCFQWPP